MARARLSAEAFLSLTCWSQTPPNVRVTFDQLEKSFTTSTWTRRCSPPMITKVNASRNATSVVRRERRTPMARRGADDRRGRFDTEHRVGRDVDRSSRLLRLGAKRMSRRVGA